MAGIQSEGGGDLEGQGGGGGRRLEPAPLLKVKKLNKAKIWVQLAGMEVGQNGEEMGGER